MAERHLNAIGVQKVSFRGGWMPAASLW